MILARVSHPAHFGGRGSSRFILGRVPLMGLLKNMIPGSCNTGSKSRLLKNTIPEHLTGVHDPKLS